MDKKKKIQRRRNDRIIDMIYSPKVDYGLFRASRSHNPAQHSCSMGPLPHYALMSGRANTLSLHCKQACVEVRLLAL